MGESALQVPLQQLGRAPGRTEGQRGPLLLNHVAGSAPAPAPRVPPGWGVGTGSGRHRRGKKSPQTGVRLLPWALGAPIPGPGLRELPATRAGEGKASGSSPRGSQLSPEGGGAGGGGLEAATLPGRGGSPAPPPRLPEPAPTGRERPPQGPGRALGLGRPARGQAAASLDAEPGVRSVRGAAQSADRVRAGGRSPRARAGAPRARPSPRGPPRARRRCAALPPGRGRPHSPCPRTAGSRRPRWRRC